jgi:tripartite-type tricarboxylate transporter receptor subunit TctC
MIRLLMTGLLVGSFAAACPAAIAQQPAYPSRAISIVVPQSPGSGNDVVARMLAEKLGQQLHQAVIVDNRAGANGIIGAAYTAKQAPDGYTLMLAGVSQISFNQHLYNTIPYQPLKDFTFVAPVVDTPFVVVASKASGITSMASLIEAAKKRNVTFSSAGVGNSTHLAMEMLADKAGVKMTHVAYKGSGPALTAVMSGEVDAMVSVVGSALPQITGGKVVPVALLSQKRIRELPNVPTVKEAGLEVPVMPGWYALVGPAHMDAKVVDKLNGAVQSFLSNPEIIAKLESLYLTPLAGSAESIKQRALADSKVWGDFIAARGIQNQ